MGVGVSGEIQKELRATIEADLSEGNPDRALRSLARLWLSDPSPAAAGFADRRFRAAFAHLGTRPYRVAILRSFTIEPILPLLHCEAAAWGLPLEIHLGEFNAYTQEVLDPQSRLYEFNPQAVVLAVQTRDLAPELWERVTELSSAEVSAVADRAVSQYRQLLTSFRQRSQANVVVHNLEIPADPNRGVYDAQTLQGQFETISAVNRRLVELTHEFDGVFLLDYDGLVARHGRRNWFDPLKWQSVRLPIRASHLIDMARAWACHLLPLAGQVAKVLVCDLDNTLWGGVIGEDGLAGIQIGLEHSGAAYRDLQRTILDLRARGILLAICSKNNPDDAREVFDKHESMLLHYEHFSAVRINWEDKAQNLRELAEELNLGIDSLVLLDDNPIEREFVRNQLPDVTVLEWDACPESAIDLIRNCPLFQRLALSQEDVQRGAMYEAQRQRSEFLGAAQSLEDYYRSLDMSMEISLAEVATIPRIAQLTQKTNQLNVTTRRYTEQQIAEFSASSDHRVYGVRVVDRFGDNGLVGVMIVRTSGTKWHLDTFLMSCRVIGRTVETAMLAALCKDAIESSATELWGEFLPTKKNAPAKDIFRKHGFSCSEESDLGSVWILQLPAQAVTMPEWIRIHALSSSATHA